MQSGRTNNQNVIRGRHKKSWNSFEVRRKIRKTFFSFRGSRANILIAFKAISRRRNEINGQICSLKFNLAFVYVSPTKGKQKPSKLLNFFYFFSPKRLFVRRVNNQTLCKAVLDLRCARINIWNVQIEANLLDTIFCHLES